MLTCFFCLSSMVYGANTIDVTYSGTQYWAKTIGAANLASPNTAGFDFSPDYNSDDNSYYINLSIVATGPYIVYTRMEDTMPTGVSFAIQRIDSDDDLTGGITSQYDIPTTYGEFFRCTLGSGVTSSKEVKLKVFLKGVSLRAAPGTYSGKTIEFSF